MTNPSDKYPDGSSDIAQEHAQTDTPAEAVANDADTAAHSTLPPYMAAPDAPPAGATSSEAQGETTGAFSSLGEALAAAGQDEKPGPAISVSPDGTAVQQKVEETPLNNAAQEALKSPEVSKSKDKPSTHSKGFDSQYSSFAQTHPILSVEQAMPASVLSRVYAVPAAIPFVFLTLMLLLQVFLSLAARELWIGGEVQIANILQGVLNGDGVLLKLNGDTYAGLPPLYFWFLYGLHLLIGSQGPVLFFLASGISALLYLWAALGLGRLVGRVDGRTNLAAGILLLSTACILGVTHSAGLGLMFAALILASCIVLYRAFVSPESEPVSMILAFALAAAATMVNGPLGILMPVCAITLFALWRSDKSQLQAIAAALVALVFGLLPTFAGLPLLRLFGLLPEAQALPLEWALALLALPALLLLIVLAFASRLRIAVGAALVLMAGAFVLSGGTPYFHWPLGYVLPLGLLAIPVLLQVTPQRLFRLDFFIGLGAGLILAGTWLAAIYWIHGDLNFIVQTLLKEQLLERGLGSNADSASWSFYLLRLPLIVLPWTILFIFLPWGRLFGKGMRDGLAASRTPAGEGLAFLWSLIISALLLLSMLGDQHPHHLLPALPALAILAARALMAIEGKRAVLFRYVLAVLLFIGGLSALFGTLMLFGALPKPNFVPIPWTLPTSGGFFAASNILMVSGVMLWLVLGSSRPEGVLLVMALAATLVGYSIGSLSAPALDPVLSPKQQSLMLRAYLDKEYAVASYNVEPGIYAYYTGRAVPALKDLDAAQALAEKGNVALAMPLADAQSWSGKPECLTEAHRQWLGTQIHVVLACPAIEGLAPAQDPFGKPFDIVKEAKDLLRGFGILDSKAPQPAQPAEEKSPEPTLPVPQPVEGEPAGEAAPTQEQHAAPAPAAQEPASETPAPEVTPAPEKDQDQPVVPEQPQTPAPDHQEEQSPASQEQPATQETQPAPETTPDAGPESVPSPVEPDATPEPADTLPPTADVEKTQAPE